MFEVHEKLYEAAGTEILRATRSADGTPVVLKVLDPRRCSERRLKRLKVAFEIGRTLDAATTVRPLGLDAYQGMPALVMEDTGGISLDRLLGTPMPPGRFLTLAVSIAAAVADMHQRGVLHKDLKPGNILVDVDANSVRITDFGIATTLPCPNERPEGGVGALIEGSLPYLSPEQTGHTNRALDQRSDLYSLGVTFYEMLTGQLPFHADDPLEWVHCHVARVPAPPAGVLPTVPGPLSDIVVKLLAKEAEDRYQSAHALRRDLEHCLEAWQKQGAIPPFVLGEGDVSDRFQIPHKLYGREREIGALYAAFDRVVKSGDSELALISGYAGIGKSALVGELRKPVLSARGLFVAGKFDQYQRDIPYATFVQAFTDLVLEILASSEERVALWRDRLQSAVGAHGQLIVDVIPPIELIIGRQPPTAALPPTEAQNRFRIVFRQFIRVFAQPEHPLTIFLDDLQWADSASLALLQDLVTHTDVRHLLLVGAYRDNEVGPAHPLSLTLDSVRQDTHISEVVLRPLSRGDLEGLLGDVFRCGDAAAASLAEIVHEKTGGNPFFTVQFLTALVEEHLIEFHRTDLSWRFDVERIRAKGYTDNVVDLMVGKLKRLTPTIQESLEQLACLGASATAAELAVVLDQSPEATEAALAEAARAGLLVRADDRYKFLHDRVQEAAYSLVPPEQRPAAHLRIGRLLLAATTPAAMAERVFDIVNQLNRGLGLISDAHERATLRALNTMAGRKARAAVAYGAARNHFAAASALSPDDAWTRDYEETFALYREWSECEYLSGNFPGAEQLFETALAHARSKADRAQIYRLRLRMCQVSGRYDDGMNAGLEAMRLFALTCPEAETDVAAAVEAERAAIADNLAGRRIADLAAAPEITDADVRALLGLLVDVMPSAYIARPPLFPLLALKALNLSLRHGNAEESAFAYSVYAMMLVSFGEIPAAFEFSELALRVNDQFNDLKLKGTLVYLHGTHINFWSRPFASSLPILERAFIACLDGGNLVFAGLNTFQTVWLMIEGGQPLDRVLEAAGKNAAFAKECHNHVAYETVRLQQQFIASLKGKTRGPSSFDEAGEQADRFDERACLATLQKAAFVPGIAFFHIMKQIAAFTHERHDEALAAARAAEAVLAAVRSLSWEATHHLFYALTLAALYPEVPGIDAAEVRRVLGRQLDLYALWAANCPENYRSRHALISAELARIDGREVEAMRLYQDAITAAVESDLVQEEALANELAARFYRKVGIARVADSYLADARSAYLRWGADGKVKELERALPRAAERGEIDPRLTFTVGSGQLDALSVLKASQAISGEILLEKLLGTLIRVVIEQAGAQRGCLLVERDGQLVIEAEAVVEIEGSVRVQLLGGQPAAASQLVSPAIINYVWRTQQQLLLDNAGETPKWVADDYIARTRAKSILCVPVRKQAEPVGLLYLENNLVTGAFRGGSVAVLEVLAAQAAISLENARLLAQVQQAVAIRDEFLSIASHELRTPINTLQLVVQAVTTKVVPTTPEAMWEALSSADRQVRRLIRLVEELLDVARIQAGHLTLCLERCELGAIVREAAARFETQLSRDNYALTITTDDTIAGRWDRSRVDQVVTNLLSNAVKFGEGKPIAIRVEEATPRVARLTVHDQGIGIPSERLPYIFDRFERAVSPREYGGLGLGLYISRRIVEGLGGTIAVESSPDQGSTFTVLLPCDGPCKDDRPGKPALSGFAGSAHS